MAYTPKGKEEVIEAALAVLAAKEQDSPSSIPSVSAREVWSSMITTGDNQYVTEGDILDILKAAQFKPKWDNSGGFFRFTL